MNFSIGNLNFKGDYKVKSNKNFTLNPLKMLKNDIFERQRGSLARELTIAKLSLAFRNYMDKNYIRNAVNGLSDVKLLFLTSRVNETTDFVPLALKNKNYKNIDKKTMIKLAFCEQVDFINNFYDSSAPKKYDGAKDLLQEYDINQTELKNLFNAYYDPNNHISSIKLIEEKIEEILNPNPVTIEIEEEEYDDKNILFDKIEKQYTIPIKLNKELAFLDKLKATKFSDVLNEIKKSIEEGNYKLTKADFKNIFKDFDLSKYNKEPLEDGEIYSRLSSAIYSFFKYLNIKYETIREIIDAVPIEKNENSIDYYRKIIEIFNSKEEQAKFKKEKILSNISYSEHYENPKKNLLTEKQKEELAKERAFNSFKGYCSKFISEHVRGRRLNTEPYDYETVFTTVLEDYCEPFKKDKFSDGTVVRWMYIGAVNTDFFDTFPSEGETYIFPRHQSCSKRADAAENEFRDSNSDMNVKFVIYPKNKDKFKAYDIGLQKYGAKEVIYPKDSKFKVLYKDWEEFETPERKLFSKDTENVITRRQVIYLQEI